MATLSSTLTPHPPELTCCHVLHVFHCQTVSVGLVGAGAIGNSLLGMLVEQRAVLRTQFGLDLQIRAVANGDKVWSNSVCPLAICHLERQDGEKFALLRLPVFSPFVKYNPWTILESVCRVAVPLEHNLRLQYHRDRRCEVELSSHVIIYIWTPRKSRCSRRRVAVICCCVSPWPFSMNLAPGIPKPWHKKRQIQEKMNKNAHEHKNTAARGAGF